jgi:Flp pilus assembly protein TadB
MTAMRRVFSIAAAAVLTAGVWVAHGPWYALIAVLGGVGLVVVAETRAKHRKEEGRPP